MYWIFWPHAVLQVHCFHSPGHEWLSEGVALCGFVGWMRSSPCSRFNTSLLQNGFWPCIGYRFNVGAPLPILEISLTIGQQNSNTLSEFIGVGGVNIQTLTVQTNTCHQTHSKKTKWETLGKNLQPPRHWTCSRWRSKHHSNLQLFSQSCSSSLVTLLNQPPENGNIVEKEHYWPNNNKSQHWWNQLRWGSSFANVLGNQHPWNVPGRSRAWPPALPSMPLDQARADPEHGREKTSCWKTNGLHPKLGRQSSFIILVAMVLGNVSTVSCGRPARFLCLIASSSALSLSGSMVSSSESSSAWSPGRVIDLQ